MNSILEVILIVIKNKGTNYSSFYYIYKKIISLGYNIDKNELRYYLNFLVNKTKNLKREKKRYVLIDPIIKNSSLLIEDNFFDYISIHNKSLQNSDLSNDFESNKRSYSNSDSDSDSAIPVFIFGNKSSYDDNMDSDEIDEFFLNNEFYSEDDNDEENYEFNNDNMEEDDEELDYEFFNIFDEENYEVMSEFIKLTNDNEIGYEIYNLDDKPITLLSNSDKKDDINKDDKETKDNIDEKAKDDLDEETNDNIDEETNDNINDKIKVKLSINIDKAKIFNNKKEEKLNLPIKNNKINIIVELSNELLDWLKKNRNKK